MDLSLSIFILWIFVFAISFGLIILSNWFWGIWYFKILPKRNDRYFKEWKKVLPYNLYKFYILTQTKIHAILSLVLSIIIFGSYGIFIQNIFNSSTLVSIIKPIGGAFLILSLIGAYLLTCTKIKKLSDQLLSTFPHFNYGKITINTENIQIRLIKRKYVRGMVVTKSIKDYARLLNNFQPTRLWIKQMFNLFASISFNMNIFAKKENKIQITKNGEIITLKDLVEYLNSYQFA